MTITMPVFVVVALVFTFITGVLAGYAIGLTHAVWHVHKRDKS